MPRQGYCFPSCLSGALPVPCLLCKDGQHPIPQPFGANVLWLEKPRASQPSFALPFPPYPVPARKVLRFARSTRASELRAREPGDV